MRKFLVFLVGASTMMLTSCIDMVEQMYLNKDGSGKYVMEFDMSGMFSNPFMMGMMEESMKKELQLEEGEKLEKDSMMYFRDMPGADNLTADELKMLGDAKIHMVMSEEKKQLKASTEIAFNSLPELEKINVLIQKVSGEDGQTGGMMGGTSPFSSGARFQLKKRTLTRMPTPPVGNVFEDEQMQMAKMIFEGATVTTIYHLPGKVKKTSIKNAKIDGKTVTVTSDILDLMEEKVAIEGDIIFKKR